MKRTEREEKRNMKNYEKLNNFVAMQDYRGLALHTHALKLR